MPSLDTVAWNGKLLNITAFHADERPLDLEMAAAQAGFIFSELNARERTKWGNGGQTVEDTGAFEK